MCTAAVCRKLDDGNVRLPFKMAHSDLHKSDILSELVALKKLPVLQYTIRGIGTQRRNVLKQLKVNAGAR